MQKRKNSEKNALDEQIWLDYFNRVLREQGVITETEYYRMQAEIRARCFAGAAQDLSGFSDMDDRMHRKTLKVRNGL